MTKMETKLKYKTCLQGIAALAQSFPDRKFDIKLMFQFLKDLEDDRFLKSIHKIVATKTELYPGTNIIALIRENALVDDRLSSGEAWAEVLNEMHNYGVYDKPVFSDDLVAKAVDCIGWRNLCLSENSVADRAHFMKIYDTLENRDKKIKLLPVYNCLELIEGAKS